MGQNYKLHVPPNIPAALFWSVTVYDPITGSGLDNGQPFPSINTMDSPVERDGTTDFYFGPKSPGKVRTGWPRSRARACLSSSSLRPEEGVLRPDLEAG